jgi:hypothetical protein
MTLDDLAGLVRRMREAQRRDEQREYLDLFCPTRHSSPGREYLEWAVDAAVAAVLDPPAVPAAGVGDMYTELGGEG